MVPMGGNTGLVGGTVGPLGPDSVVVDLTGLRDLTVDPIAGVARAGAGSRWPTSSGPLPMPAGTTASTWRRGTPPPSVAR